MTAPSGARRPAGGRPALVLLPGLLCDERLWRAQIGALGDVADITVADLARGGSIAAMAAGVLDAAPPSFALAGLSMGGYVALEIMRRAPGRVDRLALLATSARADSPAAAARRRDLVALVRRGRFREMSGRLLAGFVHEDRLGDARLMAEIAGMAGSLRPAFARQQEAMLGRRDSRPLLGAIACRTLVVCGREDRVTPLAMSEEIAALVPGARLAVIERCGHLATMERPAEVSAEMRAWLAAPRQAST